MASKRKKSRPTKIEKDENLHLYENGERSDVVEDSLKRIQRFIEEESEDTPDACFERTKWSPVKKKLGQSDPVMPIGTPPLEGDCPNVFSTVHIPSNLKFHQLQMDEIEKRTEDSVFTDSVEPKVNGRVREERVSLKPVATPLPKKCPSKRAKVSDDEPPRYSCSTCKYVTNRSDHYKRHLMTHSADKPLKCSMCNYSTGRSDHYKRHLQRHGLSEKDIIETCSRNGLKLKSTSLSALSDASNGTANSDNVLQKRQSKSGDGTARKRYKCQTCSYATDKMSHFTRHQSCHMKTGVIQCDKCNKSFKSKSYFSQHKCRYLSDRHCPVCRTIFIDKHAVRLHLASEHCDSKIVAKGEDAVGINSTVSNIDLITDKLQCTGKNGQEVTIVGTTVEDEKPMDLTINDRPSKTADSFPKMEDNLIKVEISHMTAKNEIVTEPSVSEQIVPTDEASESADFLPNLPSPRGNLGCTKCGVWFNKLNEYSSHACVS